jgi:hypothetical protein
MLPCIWSAGGLLGGAANPETAVSSQMVKWELITGYSDSGSDISNWLRTEPTVEGVKYTGKVRLSFHTSLCCPHAS